MEKVSDLAEAPLSQPKSVKGEYMYAMLLKLRARTPGTLVPYSGQLAHAALLHWFAEVEPALAIRLHEPNQRRPFTCATLWSDQIQKMLSSQQPYRPHLIQPGQTCWLRFTLLSEQLFQTFMARFFQSSTISSSSHSIGNGPGLPTLRLGDIYFDVVEVLTQSSSTDNEPIYSWCGHSSYRALVEKVRTHNQPSGEKQTLRMHFASPTAFGRGQRAGGKHLLLFPEPERLFDTLAHVWNAWAPDDLALDIQVLSSYIYDWVTVSDYQLYTRKMTFDTSPQEGFLGYCIYRFLETMTRTAGQSLNVGANLTCRQVLCLLGQFAFYAGIGYKTTMGMGQARCYLP